MDFFVIVLEITVKLNSKTEVNHCKTKLEGLCSKNMVAEGILTACHSAKAKGSEDL